MPDTVNPPNANPPTDRPATDPKEAFLAQYETQPATLESALTTTAQQLQAACTAAAAEFREVPTLNLDADDRDRMAGKRYPELNEVARLMAKGLSRVEDLQRTSGVTPQAVLAVIEQDEAATSLARAGAMISEGAADGHTLAGATLETLCDRALQNVEKVRSDPRADPRLRADLETMFGDAQRLRAEVQAQQREQRRKNEAAIAPLVQERDKAQREADENRMIDAFLASIRKG